MARSITAVDTENRADGKCSDFYFLTNHLKWTAIDVEEP